MAQTSTPSLTTEQLQLVQRMTAGLEGPLSSSLSGWEPKRLWFPVADGGTYEERAFAEGFDSRFDGRSLVPADLDGDGDLELVLLNRAGQRLQLFENVGKNGRAVELELQASTGAREADGALVRVDGAGLFTVALGRGYASAVPPAVHVGVGAKEAVFAEVQWRSGRKERFGPLAAGARHVLLEGGRVARSVPFAKQKVEPAPSWPGTLEALGLPRAGVPTVVQLFTAGCKPCAEEAPRLQKLDASGRAKLHALGVVTAGTVDDAARALGLSYPARALPEPIFDALARGGELSVPMLLVYGTDGALIRVLPGDRELETVLSEGP